MATANGSKLLARTVLGVAAVATLAVTGCSAGQVTQTDTQVAPVTGNSAVVGDVSLQDLMIQFNGIEGYPAGGNAPLVVRIFNLGTEFPDRLIAVSSPAAESVTIVGGDSEPAPTDDPESPDPDAESPDPDAETPDGESPDAGDESPSPDAETPTPPADEQGSTTIDLPVEAASFLMLVPGEGVFLQLEGITEDLRPGSIVEVTFTFERAGTVTINIPMGLPLSPEDREHAETGDGGH